MSIIKRFPAALVVLFIALVMAFALSGCESDETKAAKEGFNNEVSRIQEEFDSLQSEISNAEELVLVEDKALDESLRPALEDAISDAKTVEFDKPSLPSNEANEIDATTEELKRFSFTEEIESLQNAETALSESIEKYKLVDNPSEAFVIERLRGVEGVGEIAACTEETDSNGLLGKSGTYVVKVVFSSPNVDQSVRLGESIAEAGPISGGSIEVFTNEDDAKKRESYLASFDGGWLSSGSHKIIGTTLVRTSDKLTATQQKELEAAIIKALTKLPESESE